MNAKLNEKTELTEKVIRILVTTLCNRNCKVSGLHSGLKPVFTSL